MSHLCLRIKENQRVFFYHCSEKDAAPSPHAPCLWALTKMVVELLPQSTSSGDLDPHLGLSPEVFLGCSPS